MRGIAFADGKFKIEAIYPTTELRNTCLLNYRLVLYLFDIWVKASCNRKVYNKWQPPDFRFSSL